MEQVPVDELRVRAANNVKRESQVWAVRRLVRTMQEFAERALVSHLAAPVVNTK
jgi:hypothetical protein